MWVGYETNDLGRLAQQTVNFFSHYSSNDADWFLKADDDTYVIVDNLRRVLRDHDPTKPEYMGCRFKPYVTQGYMSGGAGKGRKKKRNAEQN